MTDDNSSLPPETAPQQQTLWDRAWDPCDIASVAFFRVVFGLTVLGYIGVFFSRNGIEYFFERPEYHLPFFGFEWVRALDADGMRRIQYLTAMAAVGVTLGFLYRISAVVLFLTFTYTFLCDAAQYQNHLYLISLVAFLMIYPFFLDNVFQHFQLLDKVLDLQFQTP